MSVNNYLVLLVWIQGGYFLLTGLWPLIHISSFMAVSGSKNDLWLVRTVGVLITSIAIGLVASAIRKKVDGAVMLIAAGAALSLLLVDVVYVFKKVLSKVYLADALAELFFLICWGVLVLNLKNKKQLHR